MLVFLSRSKNISNKQWMHAWQSFEGFAIVMGKCCLMPRCALEQSIAQWWFTAGDLQANGPNHKSICMYAIRFYFPFPLLYAYNASQFNLAICVSLYRS